MNRISEVLHSARTIAVVGLSGKRYRPSYGVAEYLKRAGYRIIPVNPMEKEVLGERSYPDLESIPEPVDLVDVFRRSEDIPSHLDDMLAKRPSVVWFQSGIRNDEVAETLARAGIKVVQDRCLMVEHRRHCPRR